MLRTFLALALISLSAHAAAEDIPNPLIDYNAFQDGVKRVGVVREIHRVSEFEFVHMASDPSTVILDARSAEKFALVHVRSAKNLSLPDITEEELAKIIPSKSTRILIYCNNNFTNEPEAFPAKNLAASLNVYTMNVLFAYGYTNVYELGPLVDIRKSIIPFERAKAVARRTR